MREWLSRRASLSLPPAVRSLRLAALTGSTALLALGRAVLAPGAARAQDTVVLDRVVLDRVTVEGGGEAGNGRTGPGGVNEQEGFVARRSAGATKTKRPLIETPRSISVVTSDEIERQEQPSIRATTRYTAAVTPEITGGSLRLPSTSISTSSAAPPSLHRRDGISGAAGGAALRSRHP